MAIVMSVDFPDLIPGGHSRFHKTDIASFGELLNSAHVVSARCLGDGRSVGWFQDGETWNILSYPLNVSLNILEHLTDQVPR